MTTAQERAELRKLAEAATQGEWNIDRHRTFITSIGPCAAEEYAGSAWLDVSEKDAAYIKAAVENTPKLLDDIDRLTAERDSYKADAERYRWLTSPQANGMLCNPEQRQDECEFGIRDHTLPLNKSASLPRRFTRPGSGFLAA